MKVSFEIPDELLIGEALSEESLQDKEIIDILHTTFELMAHVGTLSSLNADLSFAQLFSNVDKLKAFCIKRIGELNYQLNTE